MTEFLGRKKSGQASIDEQPSLTSRLPDPAVLQRKKGQEGCPNRLTPLEIDGGPPDKMWLCSLSMCVLLPLAGVTELYTRRTGRQQPTNEEASLAGEARRGIAE
jgi:hypothetical protein